MGEQPVEADGYPEARDGVRDSEDEEVLSVGRPPGEPSARHQCGRTEDNGPDHALGRLVLDRNHLGGGHAGSGVEGTSESVRGRCQPALSRGAPLRTTSGASRNISRQTPEA